MNKFKKTLLNSITSLITVFINSIFSLILGRIIIEHLGSDYNGVNATVTQILTILTLVEGGFTTASIVALFDPYVSNDELQMNRILSTSSRIFKRIAKWSLILGIAISLVYTFVIKSSIDRITIFIVFFLSICSTSFNLYVVNTYRIMYQVSQKEYLLNIIIVILNILMQICSIVIIVFTENIIIVRSVYFIFSIIQGIVIIYVAKRKYPFIKLDEEYKPELIKGTKDVMIGKLTSVIYSSTTILFLSTFVGTTITSVYAIYNNVVNIIKNCLYSVINAPQNAIGQLIASKNEKKLSEVFYEYEYIVFVCILSLMSITYIMIIPFVKLYTKDIADINYLDFSLPILIISIASLELIHIPSGILILMSGNFKVSRNIQTVTCIMLIVFNLVGVILFDLNGLLIGTLLATLILAIMEIVYAHIYIMKSTLSRYIKVYLPFAAILLSMTYFISEYVWDLEYTIYQFFLYGCIITLLILASSLILSFILNKTETINFLRRIKLFKM